MLVACEVCNTKSKNLFQWNLHLSSRRHQLTANTEISLWHKSHYPEPSQTAVETEFYILRALTNDGTTLKPLDTISRFGRYGFVHNFYINSTYRSAVVQLELSYGITESYIIEDWNLCAFYVKQIDKESLALELGDDFSTINDINLAESQGYSRNKDVTPCSVVTNGEAPAKVIEATVESGTTGSLTLPGSLELSARRKRIDKLRRNPSKHCLVYKATRSPLLQKSLISQSLQSILEEAEDFHEQLELFLEEGKITELELDQCKMFTQKLSMDLIQEWPNCELSVIGSYMTGLADKDSELDLTILQPNASQFQENGTYNGVERVDPENLIYKTLQKIRKPSKKKSSIELIKRKEYTFIRLCDKDVGITCNLTLNKIMAVRSSQLITFFVNFDPRVNQLMSYVRQWAKLYKVSGPNGLSNYALSLLVLVFLARKKVLPTICQLQAIAPVQEIGLWNTGFCEDPEVVENLITSSRSTEDTHYNNNATPLEWARDFFQMVANEDFQNFAICSLTAESIPKCKFPSAKKIRTLPQSNERLLNSKAPNGVNLFITTPFSVQDPFELTSNIGRGVKQESCNLIITTFRKAAEYYSDLLKISTQTKLSIPLLFPSGEQIPQESIIQTSASMLDYSIHSITSSETLMEIDEKIKLCSNSSFKYKKFRKIKENILNESSMLQFSISDDFVALFLKKYERGEQIISDKNCINMLFLWCDLAKKFVKQVWSISYFLNTEVLGEYDEIITGEELSSIPKPVYCLLLSLEGLNFDADQYLKLRSSGDGNPLDWEGNSARIAQASPKYTKMKTKFSFKCLVILEMSKNIEPRLSIIFTDVSRTGGRSIPELKKQIDYIGTGVQLMFPRYQVYMLNHLLN